MLKVGLTGGIGSGKTAISDAFKALDTPIIDTDIIAREVLSCEKNLLKQLAATFGQEILDNKQQLIRSKLRDIAFKDKESKAKLDAIMHPAIRQASIEQIHLQEQQQSPYCIVVVPLLIETGFIKLVDRVLVVTAPFDKRLSWLEKRSELSKEKATKIISSQTSDEEKLALADDHINNESDLATIQTKVAQLHKHYLKLAN